MIIRDWYIKEFSDDEMRYELKHNVTFADLFHALDRYQDIYDLIGVDDSVIRERVFTKLAEIIETDYDYIYDQWLLGA